MNKKELSEYAIKIAKHTANKMQGTVLDFDEAFSAALVGAAIAVTTWRPDSGSTLKTWVFSKCKWAVLDAIREERNLPREMEQVTEDELLPEQKRAIPFSQFSAGEWALAEVLPAMNDPEAEVIEKIYREEIQWGFRRELQK